LLLFLSIAAVRELDELTGAAELNADGSGAARDETDDVQRAIDLRASSEWREQKQRNDQQQVENEKRIAKHSPFKWG
jgi:hypothetical protein